MKMLFGLIATSCLLAQGARAITLEECRQLVRQYHPSLRAARAQVEGAAGRATQAGLWPNPELELAAEDMPADNVGLSDSVNWVGLAQTVPFPGKKSIERRIGNHDRQTREWEGAVLERALIREVTAAFYRVLALEEKQHLTADLETLARSLADAARQRVEAGAASDQELLRAEIEAERATVESATTRRELLEARQALATLLGPTAIPLGGVEGELSTAVALPVVDSRTLDAHPQLHAASANRERAQLALRRARLEPFPDVTIGAAYGRDGAANENLVEFRVSVPLPLVDRGQGRQQDALAETVIAAAEYEATEQELAQQLATATARLQTAQEHVNAYRTRILPRAEKALDLVRGGFEAGKFGFLDLVDTQRTAAEARLTYLDKLLELNLAHADYEALTGTQPKE